MNEVAGRKPLDAARRLGQILAGRYRLDSLLGAGGMAIVYAATDRDGTRVAIKVLRAEVAADATVRQLFAREGKLANQVAHAGAPKILDEGVTGDGLPFLAQTLVRGETVLARARREGGTLRAAEVLAIADQVLEVLSVAHDAGVVHRDVRPSNLMVGTDGEVYVLDFGLARHSANSVATSSAVHGTRAFRAPEQAIPGGHVDARADLFSVGAMVFHLLTGASVPAGGLPPEVPLSIPLKRWLVRAVSAKAQDRWPDSSTMRSELHAVFERVIGEPLADPRAIILGAWRRRPIALADTRETASKGDPAAAQRSCATEELNENSQARLVSFSPVKRGDTSPGSVGPGPGVASPRLRPQSSFGRYRVEACIGRGGMGEVYRAHDIILQRTVALKIVVNEKALTASARERLLREARAVAAIRHPNVVAIHDAGDVDGVSFLAMEYVEGRTLRAVLRDGLASVSETLRVLSSVANALSAAHARHVIHRDIKPENIMLSDDGTVKVLDFGIAWRSDDASRDGIGDLTGTGNIVGSPKYMSPEQLRDDCLDGRSDQFAWGILACECLTGEYPFAKQSSSETIAAILTGNPNPSTLAQIGNMRLRAIVARALRPSPKERYSRMEEVVRALAVLAPAANASGATETAGQRAGADPKTAILRNAITRTSEMCARATDRAGWPKRYQIPIVAIGVGLVASALFARRPSLDRPRDERLMATESVPSKVDVEMRRSAPLEAAYQTILDGSTELARSKLQEAIKLDPTDARAHLYYLLVAFYIGSEEREHYQSAVALRQSMSGADLEVLSALAPVMSEPPDANDCIHKLSTVVAKYPVRADLRLALAKRQAHAQDLAGASKTLDDALTIMPNIASLWMFRGVVRAFQNRITEAMEAYDACLKLAPLAGSCLRDQATIAGVEGECERVEALGHRLIAAAPESSEGFLLVGQALLAQGKPMAQARSAFEQGWLRQGGKQTMFALRDQYDLELYSGRFDVGERVLTAQAERLAGSADEYDHAVWFSRSMLHQLELGHVDATAALANRALDGRVALLKDDFFDYRLESYGFLYLAGAIGRAEFAGFRDSWLRETEFSGVGSPTRKKLAAYVGYAKDAEDARVALAALPMPFPQEDVFHRDASVEERIGNVFQLAGQLADAEEHLVRATRWCGTYEPIRQTQAYLRLGMVYEAGGKIEKACSSYAVVLRRWASEARSSTLKAARARFNELKCGAGSF